MPCLSCLISQLPECLLLHLPATVSCLQLLPHPSLRIRAHPLAPTSAGPRHRSRCPRSTLRSAVRCRSPTARASRRALSTGQDNARCAVQIIYCAGARIRFTGAFNRVENLGVSNIARCWLDVKHRLALKAHTRADVTKLRMADFQKEDAQARGCTLVPLKVAPLMAAGAPPQSCLATRCPSGGRCHSFIVTARRDQHAMHAWTRRNDSLG
jgi:hypothetical protein